MDTNRFAKKYVEKVQSEQRKNNTFESEVGNVSSNRPSPATDAPQVPTATSIGQKFKSVSQVWLVVSILGGILWFMALYSEYSPYLDYLEYIDVSAASAIYIQFIYPVVSIICSVFIYFLLSTVAQICINTETILNYFTKTEGTEGE